MNPWQRKKTLPAHYALSFDKFLSHFILPILPEISLYIFQFPNIYSRNQVEQSSDDQHNDSLISPVHRRPKHDKSVYRRSSKETQSEPTSVHIDTSTDVPDIETPNSPDTVLSVRSPDIIASVPVSPIQTDEAEQNDDRWSRSKSFDLEFSDYESEQLHSPKPPDSPSEHSTLPPPPSVPLYILSQTNKWRECQVVEVLEDGKKWKIHYKGFKSKFDEIVDVNSDRLTFERPESVIPKRKKTIFYPYDRIWVQSTNHEDIYREAVITEVMVDKYKVHFISYHPKYDCEIDKGSSRLKSLDFIT